MNGTLPTQQHYSQRPTKYILLFIIFDVILLILLVGTLNYFNFLSLSYLFPNQLGFLPRRDAPDGTSQREVPTGTSQQSQQPKNAPISSTPLKISCPSIKEFCEKGETIIKDNGYFGLGYKLSSGSAIFAAFDGDLTATSSAMSSEIDGKEVTVKFKTAYLDSPSLNFRATYFLKGEIIKSGKVNMGEQIAVSSGKPIIIYNNSSLVFSLTLGYPATNNPVILNKEYFE